MKRVERQGVGWVISIFFKCAKTDLLVCIACTDSSMVTVVEFQSVMQNSTDFYTPIGIVKEFLISFKEFWIQSSQKLESSGSIGKNVSKS